MRTIRKIGLRNAAGERYELNGERGVYASDLAGFGITLDPDFADLGHGFFAVSGDTSEPQGAVSFKLTFTRGPYSEYKAFIDWVSAASALELVYNPTGDQEYYRSISIASLQKGELNNMGWLECPCSVFCKTRWYMPVPSALSLEVEDTSMTKCYPYQYKPSLRYGTGGSAALSGSVFKSGHIPAALEITYYGQIVNPVIRITGNSTGKVYGICALAVSLSATDTLKFSSKYENSYAKKVDADGLETDLLDVLDLRFNPFFRVPVDEACTISIESDSAITGRAELQVYYYFRSV